MAFETPQLFGLIAAVGGGLLVGTERERRKGDGEARDPAGVRTFTLIALTGAVAALLGEGASWIGGGAVTAFALVAYLRADERDPGITTEVAMLTTYLLGVLAQTEAALAAALFVALTALLAGKQAMHRFTRQVLSEQELGDALLLLGSVLIVLPLLPDQPVDPWGVLNLRKLWLVAVFVMTLQAAGYVALRVFGDGRGLALAGFLGGFVSSVATIGAMGGYAKSKEALRRSAISGALASNVSTIVQLAILLLALSPALLRHMAVPLAAAGAVAIGAALVFLRRGAEAPARDKPVAEGRAFQFGKALLFAAIVGSALALAALLRHWIGTGGVLAAAAATGFADVHAAAVWLGQMVGQDGLELRDAGIALTLAFGTNALMKCVAAVGSGGWRFALPIVIGVALITLTLVTAVVLL